MAHQKALAEAVRQGVLLTRSEVERFLSSKKAKKKYAAIMNAIATGARSWSQVKAALERKLGFKVSDSQLADYLNTLSSHEFIAN
ncbi:MAG: hypothetical protein NTX79_00485 [Candidatus Micrarchaeota archaeon]|nr:hypothetical protein [Candidatus Micrarchaeota archaeon]